MTMNLFISLPFYDQRGLFLPISLPRIPYKRHTDLQMYSTSKYTWHHRSNCHNFIILALVCTLWWEREECFSYLGGMQKSVMDVWEGHGPENLGKDGCHPNPTSHGASILCHFPGDGTWLFRLWNSIVRASRGVWVWEPDSLWPKPYI